MKVQKISKNKAIIVLSHEELAKRKISIKDIKDGNKKAKNFFFEILEESEIYENFELESSQLLIEVSETNDGLLKVTIATADCIPDINFISKMRNTKNITYTVSSNLYEFESLDNLYSFAIRALKENLYIGANTLYIINNSYYLYFSNSTIKNFNFVRTFSVISEYCSKYYSQKSLSFAEYSLILFKNNAIQELQKI